MNLWQASEGQRVRVHDYATNLPETYKTRLIELGFHPGEEVVCLKWSLLGGPHLFAVENCIYSLDRDIATMVEVSEVKS